MPNSNGTNGGQATMTVARRVKAGYVNQQMAPKQRRRRWVPPQRLPVGPGTLTPAGRSWPSGFYR